VVDTQNVRQSTTVPRELLDSIPIGKQYADVAALVPGMGRSAQDVGGQLGQSWNFLSIHGGRQNDTKTQVDGMTIQAANNQSTTGIYFSDGNYQEFLIETGAFSAESETGGVRVNMIPREG